MCAIIPLKNPDDWNSTAVESWTIENSVGDTRKNQYGDLFCTMIQPAANQIFGTLCPILEYLGPIKFVCQTTSSQTTRGKGKALQWTRTKLSSSSLHPKVKSLTCSTTDSRFNKLDHILTAHMSTSSQKISKTTYESLHLTHTFTFKVLALYLQMETVVRTEVYLLPVDIYLKYIQRRANNREIDLETRKLSTERMYSRTRPHLMHASHYRQ